MDPVPSAVANLLSFQLPAAPLDEALEAELVDTLNEIRRLYRQKAEQSKRAGVFYVWMDEMSGTMRCSFCPVASFGELPFGCALKRARSLSELVASIAAEAAHPIPLGAFSEVAWSEPEEASELELLVFADLN